jgi:branched-chain amino acid transport system ATP-binding protein
MFAIFILAEREAVLALDDVHAGYGATPVLRGVSLTVADREIVGVIGRNGAGKTTLLKTIIGLLPAWSGRLQFEGEELLRVPAYKRVRRRIAYVPQGRWIFAGLSVHENLLVGADLVPGCARGRIDEVLDQFPRLRDRMNQPGETLSGGEQQMLAIGRALVGNPKLLLLDEPTAGIQPSIVSEIAQKLVEIRDSGKVSILLIEQNIDLVAQLATRVYVMEKGEIAAEIMPQQVMDEGIIRNYLVI